MTTDGVRAVHHTCAQDADIKARSAGQECLRRVPDKLEGDVERRVTFQLLYASIRVHECPYVCSAQAASDPIRDSTHPPLYRAALVEVSAVLGYIWCRPIAFRVR